MAEWAAKNGIKKVVTMVSDYAPGIDAEKCFVEDVHRRRAARCRDHHASRCANPDFAPFLQRARRR